MKEKVVGRENLFIYKKGILPCEDFKEYWIPNLCAWNG